MTIFNREISFSILSQLSSRPGLVKVLNNVGWLLFDKIFRLASGLFLGIFIARYLGPANYGLLNYAAAFSALMGSFVTLGLESIVVRELIKNPIEKDRILGSAFFLRIFASFLGFCLNMIIITFIKPGETFIYILVALSSIGFVFQGINVIDLYYQSYIKSKFSIIAQDSAFFIFVIVRIFLLIINAPLIAFAIAGSIETILISIFTILVYHKISKSSIFNWRFDMKIACGLLTEGWPLMLAGIASIINMRLDQVMLGTMLDQKSVGIYAVAVRISEVWFVLPLFLGMSLYPSLISSKESSYLLYRKRLHKIVFAMACFAIPFAIIITFISPFIINKLYGPEFSAASNILSIHIWSGLPYVIAFAYGQAFYIEKITRLTLYSAIYTVVCNVILNSFLIPKYGGQGAAFSTLFSALSAFIISMILLHKNSDIFTNSVKSNH